VSGVHFSKKAAERDCIHDNLSQIRTDLKFIRDWWRENRVDPADGLRWSCAPLVKEIRRMAKSISDEIGLTR